MVQTREEEKYAREYKKTGDSKYRDLAVEEMRDLIFSTVRAMNLSQSLDTRSLYIKGLGLAAKAVETWDPDKAKLSTHVVNALNPLKRVVYQSGPTLHTPEHSIKDFSNFKGAFSNYIEEHGTRDVDATELADITGLSLKKVKEFLKRERMTFNDSTMSTVNVGYLKGDHRISFEYLEEEYKGKPLHQRIIREIAKVLKKDDKTQPNAREIHRKIGGSYYEVNKAYKDIVEKINDYLKTIS